MRRLSQSKDENGEDVSVFDSFHGPRSIHGFPPRGWGHTDIPPKKPVQTDQTPKLLGGFGILDVYRVYFINWVVLSNSGNSEHQDFVAKTDSFAPDWEGLDSTIYEYEVWKCY